MQNLRDKLLKAGLVTADQTEKAQTDAEKKPERPPPRSPPHEARNLHHPRPPSRPLGRPTSRPSTRPSPRAAVEVPIPKLPPLPGSKAAQRLEAIKQRELDDALKELVLGGQVPLQLGSRPFHFVTRKGRLRRLELAEDQARLLEEGKLAVVERQEPAQIEHSLVPPETAERMMALFPKSVRFFNKEGAPVGFLSDEGLKDAQEAEAAAPPEEPTSPQPPAEKSGDTWIAIKRAPANEEPS